MNSKKQAKMMVFGSVLAGLIMAIFLYAVSSIQDTPLETMEAVEASSAYYEIFNEGVAIATFDSREWDCQIYSYNQDNGKFGIGCYMIDDEETIQSFYADEIRIQ